MSWQKSVGVGACVIMLISCWMNWCFYPDIQQYFTGFYSFKNQYGKPGVLISIFGVLAVLLHLVGKTWANATNLAIGALCMAYAVKSVYVYVAPYDGIFPEKKFGIWLMMISVVINLITVLFAKSGKEILEEIHDNKLPAE